MPWAPLTPLFQVLWLLPLPAGEGQDHLAPAARHQEELGLPHALGLQGALTAAGLQWSKSGPVVQLWWSISGPVVQLWSSGGPVQSSGPTVVQQWSSGPAVVVPQWSSGGGAPPSEARVP